MLSMNEKKASETEKEEEVNRERKRRGKKISTEMSAIMLDGDIYYWCIDVVLRQVWI